IKKLRLHYHHFLPNQLVTYCEQAKKFQLHKSTECYFDVLGEIQAFPKVEKVLLIHYSITLIEV
ncbi:MAG: hypothetical protein K8F24_04570, partial [Bacteroidales bacterium]|nr:hypothetical protein [Bacteroidales bacterium]